MINEKSELLFCLDSNASLMNANRSAVRKRKLFFFAFTIYIFFIIIIISTGLY